MSSSSPSWSGSAGVDPSHFCICSNRTGSGWMTAARWKTAAGCPDAAAAVAPDGPAAAVAAAGPRHHPDRDRHHARDSPPAVAAVAAAVGHVRCRCRSGHRANPAAETAATRCHCSRAAGAPGVAEAAVRRAAPGTGEPSLAGCETRPGTVDPSVARAAPREQQSVSGSWPPGDWSQTTGSVAAVAVAADTSQAGCRRQTTGPVRKLARRSETAAVDTAAENVAPQAGAEPAVVAGGPESGSEPSGYRTWELLAPRRRTTPSWTEC